MSLSAYRVVIIANGNAPSKAEIAAWLRPNDVLLCADGGAKIALQNGLTPKAVIGDFDSLSQTDLATLTQLGAQLMQFPVNKNETDLELTLLYAAGAELPQYPNSKPSPTSRIFSPLPPDEIVILGALGGRTDQTLANLMLLTLPALQSIHTIIAGNCSEAGCEQITLITPHRKTLLRGREGDIVSLLPIGGNVTGIVTNGLAYALSNESLIFGLARGVSNVMLTNQAGISISQGYLLCILCRH
jgi:thiamine pyrophosphokinase